MTAKRMLQSLTPPLLWQGLKILKQRLAPSRSGFSYAPRGWDTPLPRGRRTTDYWTAFIEKERSECALLIAQIQAGLPLDGGDGVKHLVFGYVLAIAARNTDRISVLDYGANLGDYYWLARSLVPGVDLEYHCKELLEVAAAGQHLTPAATWHTDDSCLDRSYDLVMFSSSLQYLPDWQGVLGRAARSSVHHLFLSDVPTVRNVPTFAALERSAGMTNVHHQLNRTDILQKVASEGLELIREFTMSPHPFIDDAPEQPTRVGWLFGRPQPST